MKIKINWGGGLRLNMPLCMSNFPTLIIINNHINCNNNY